MSLYIHKSHNVTVLLYHLVFPANYRRAVFDAAVDQVQRDVCLGIEARYQLKVLEIGADRDRRPGPPTGTADRDRRPGPPTGTADRDRRPGPPTGTADRDHVHVLVQSGPTYSVTKLVPTIKSLTARE